MDGYASATGRFSPSGREKTQGAKKPSSQKEIFHADPKA
jgi:hypothetical protein